MSVDDTSASKDPGPAGGPEASTATPGRCVVVVLVCYALAASFYELPKGYHWDEGQIILDSLRLAWGDLPHLDYVYTYSGGTAYLNFLVGKLFGFTVPGFRLWTVCLGAILSLGLLAVARRLVPGWWACVPPAIFAFYGVRSTFLAPYANWYCLVAWVGLALALISYRRTGSRRALAWAGVAAGLAFACKQTLGAFLLAGALFGLRLTDDRRGPTPLERTLDAVIVWGVPTAFALFTAKISSFTGNALLLLPFVLLLATHRIASRAVTPAADADPEIRQASSHPSCLVETVTLLAWFALAESVAWWPHLERGVPGLLAYLRGLLGSHAGYGAGAPHAYGFPEGWALPALAIAYVGGGLALAAAGRRGIRAPALLVPLAGAAAVALIWLGYAQSGLGFDVPDYARWKAVTYQLSTFLPILTTSLTAAFPGAETGERQRTTLVTCLCTSWFFLVLPLPQYVYYSVGTAPILVLVGLWLHRAHSRVVLGPGDAWSRRGLTAWALLAPAIFAISSLRIAMESRYHVGETPLGRGTHEFLVDEEYARSAGRLVDELRHRAVKHGQLLVFPEPAVHLFSGLRPVYKHMHFVSGCYSAADDREMPSVLDRLGIHWVAFSDFQKRGPAAYPFQELKAALEKKFSVVWHQGQFTLWERRALSPSRWSR